MHGIYLCSKTQLHARFSTEFLTNLDKLKWCKCQKKGIEIIEPKPHLSRSYIQEADETLENVFSAKGKWRTIMAYYACYAAIYSLLMKSGIKSEIHECSIELMCFFGFSDEEISYMRNLKDDRVQAQYYLKMSEFSTSPQRKQGFLGPKNAMRSLGLTSGRLFLCQIPSRKILSMLKNHQS